MEAKLIDISLVGMRALKHPPGMENWRYFRIEWGEGAGMKQLLRKVFGSLQNLDE